MGVRTALGLILAVALAASTAAEFNDCLGLEISTLANTDSCAALYDACNVGVAKLNEQLKRHERDALHPVTVVSASEAQTPDNGNTRFALLVQIAPLATCSTQGAPGSCGFNMTEVEFYSVLLKQDPSSSWSLEGYKRHELTDDQRQQIVDQYELGGEYSKTAAASGIFNVAYSATDSQSAADKNTGARGISRSPAVVFAVLAGALVAVGLLFHQRRRLQKGYAPIVVVKRVGGHVQGKLGDQKVPEQASLHVPQAIPVANGEQRSLRSEPTERFAV